MRTPSPRPPVVAIETDVPTNATAKKGTDMVIVHTRGAVKTIAHTTATPHDRSEGTATAIKMINLVATTTEDTQRLRNPQRTAKVAIMLTTWKRVSPLLVTVHVPAAHSSLGLMLTHHHAFN